MEVIKLGITGGIGSGKSVVCKILEALKIPVYYADDRAKWLTNNSTEIVAEVKSLLGNDSYSNGLLDRKTVSKKLFKDASLLQKMNAIIHPAVARDFINWTDQQRSNIIAKEAALIFETHGHKSLDFTWLVTCPQEIKIERILNRDPQRSSAEVKNIMDKQWSDQDKRLLADHVIINDDKNLVIPQVLAALEKTYSQT